MMGSPCSGTCQKIVDKDCISAQVVVEGCVCEEGMCWSGNACIKNEDWVRPKDPEPNNTGFGPS